MRIISPELKSQTSKNEKMKLLFWLIYNLALGNNETANPISLRSRETSAQFIDRLLSKLSFINYRYVSLQNPKHIKIHFITQVHVTSLKPRTVRFGLGYILT